MDDVDVFAMLGAASDAAQRRNAYGSPTKSGPKGTGVAINASVTEGLQRE